MVEHTCLLCSFKGGDDAFVGHLNAHFYTRCALCKEYWPSDTNKHGKECPATTFHNSYVCGVCLRYHAPSLTSVKSHFNTHMFKKPYQCTLCEFSAAQKVSLNTHVAHHGNPDSPFMCRQCNWGHSTARLVALHERNCHLEKEESPKRSTPQPSRPAKRQKTANEVYELTPADVEEGYIAASVLQVEGLTCPRQLAKDIYRPTQIYNFEDLMIAPHLHSIQSTRDFVLPIARIWNSTTGEVMCEMYYQTITIGRTRSVPNHEVDVNLEDDTVSKRHGMIKYIFERAASGQFTAYFVYCSFGKNGSFLGNQFVPRGRRYLSNEMILQCGTSAVKLRFQILSANIQAAQDILRNRIESEERKKDAELRAQQDW